MHFKAFRSGSLECDGAKEYFMRKEPKTITNANVFLTVLDFRKLRLTANIKLMKSGNKTDM